MLADQDLSEPEPDHDPVEHQSARADDVDPAGMHDRDGGPLCAGLAQQLAGDLVYPVSRYPRMVVTGPLRGGA